MYTYIYTLQEYQLVISYISLSSCLVLAQSVPTCVSTSAAAPSKFQSETQIPEASLVSTSKCP